MAVNWAQGAISSGGTGDLTLTAISGVPYFTDAGVWGSSGTRRGVFTILQWATTAWVGESTLREVAVCDLVLSTGTLTRLKRLSTGNGATYDAVDPAALSFASDTARTRVFCGSTADFGLGVLPFQSVVAPNGPLGTPSGHAPISNNSYAFVANREVYAPFLWTGCGDITSIGVAVTSAVASSGVKAAIYALGSNGQPAELLHDLNGGAPFDAGTGGEKSTSVTPFALEPGWYYSGMISGHAPSLRAHQVFMSPAPSGYAQTGSAVTFYFKAGSYASGMPSPASTGLTQTVTTGSPVLYLGMRA